VDWIEAQGGKTRPGELLAKIETLAEAVEPELVARDQVESEHFRPFPVDSLPKLVRRFVSAVAVAIGCDPSYLVLTLLVVAGAAIGNTRRLQLKRGWNVPAILWGMVVGESGTAKTPAMAMVMRPVHALQQTAFDDYAVEQKKYESDLAQWDKKKEGERPVPPICTRYVVSDTTVPALAPVLLHNPRGVLAYRDELAGWFGSFDQYAPKGTTGADAANWLSMFNAGTIIVDRKNGEPRTLSIPWAAVSVCGGIQPGLLRRVLGKEHRESGLPPRFLLTWPPRKAKQWTDADIDPELEKNGQTCCTGFTALNRQRVEMRNRYPKSCD
jgi:hypothetical protein